MSEIQKSKCRYCGGEIWRIDAGGTWRHVNADNCNFIAAPAESAPAPVVVHVPIPEGNESRYVQVLREQLAAPAPEAEGMERRAKAFKNRPDIYQQRWNNSLPEAQRSRDDNESWLMAAFARAEVVRALEQTLTNIERIGVPAKSEQVYADKVAAAIRKQIAEVGK